MIKFKRKKIIIFVAAAAAVISAVSLVCFLLEGEQEKEITSLVRPAFGEISRDYELNVLYEGVKEQVTVTVNERQLTFDEAETLFAEGYDEILLAMNELNGDLNSVGGDLKLPESALDERLEITWYSSDTEYIGHDGILSPGAYGELPEDGLIITMYAVVSAQEYSARFEVPVYLEMSNIKAARKNEDIIEEKLNAAQNAYPESDRVILPDNIDGVPLKYYEETESRWWRLPLIMIMVLAAGIFIKKHKEEQVREARIRSLELSYAPIVTMFTLFIGAGSSIRGAWERIADDYRDEAYANVAYEELVRTDNEMKNGMSEQLAYNAFGKRCRLSMYVRFSNLLEQNLKKGTKGITERLEAEVAEAFENRKALFLRLGEAAGTKLLLPMIMLLVIVIVICVVPAFLSM